MPIPNPEEIKAGLKIASEVGEAVAPKATAAIEHFWANSVESLVGPHGAVTSAMEHLPHVHIDGTTAATAAEHLPKITIPDEKAFAGNHTPFENVYMDWTNSTLEERHGAIAHLDKAPLSINDYLRSDIIKSAVSPGYDNLGTIPAIKLIGSSRLPMIADPAEQGMAFGWAVPFERDLPRLKVLTDVVPKLHPDVQADALKDLLPKPDLLEHLEDAHVFPLHVDGVTPEVEAALAKTSQKTGAEQYTDLVANLPVEGRRKIWDEVFGFNALKDHFDRLPQESRLQQWNEISKAPAGQIAQSDTNFQLTQHWLDGLSKGDPVIKKAFDGFPTLPEAPPDLVRKSLAPTHYEWFGEGAAKAPETPKSWSATEIENASSQRLSRLALTNETPAQALGHIETMASDANSPATQIKDKLQTLFPQIKFADNEAALARLHADANFQALAPADKTDVALATVLSDSSLPMVPTKPGLSANVAHGVLSSLDVDPVRAQRIANLVNAHDITNAALGKSKSVAWGTNPKRDLAALTRSPHQAAKLNTMISALHPADDATTNLLQAARSEANFLSRDAVPLLTTQVPKGYGAVTLQGNFSFLSHISPADINRAHFSGGIGDHFVSVLPKLESPDNPLSLALISPSSKMVYMLGDSKPSISAIFSAAPENISRVGSNDLWSHTWSEGSWSRHLDDMDAAARSPHAPKLLPDIMTGKQMSREELKHAWQKLTKFNNYDDALAAGGSDAETARTINDSLTAHIRSGYHQHSEVKAVDSSLHGFAVQRNGADIIFDGMNEQEAQNLFGGAKPSWVVEMSPDRYLRSEGQDMVVPKSVWQLAKQRSIPFVFLD